MVQFCHYEIKKKKKFKGPMCVFSKTEDILEFSIEKA